MLFDQFIATRRAVDSIAEALPESASYFENADGSARKVAGLVYSGDCYIERMEDGRFLLAIGCEEYISSDVGELEHRLYQWAVDELLF